MASWYQKRWIWIVGIVIAFAGLGSWLGLREPEAPARFILLPNDYTIPRQKGPWPDRWIPMKKSWAWVWHVKENVFGRRKAVLLEPRVVALRGSQESIFSGYRLGKPDFSSNHVDAWFISEPELRVLFPVNGFFGQEPALFSARVTTANKGQAQMFSGITIPSVSCGPTRLTIGSPTVPWPAAPSGAVRLGFTTDLLPVLRKGLTDLTAVITWTEAVTNEGSISLKTNMSLATRVQIPEGDGAFVVDSRRWTDSGVNYGVVLFATKQK